jgi:hypothetical protein
MEILRLLLAFLTGSAHSGQGVRSHTKRQAVGPRWSRHQPRHIAPYTRQRPRRNCGPMGGKRRHEHGQRTQGPVRVHG